MKLRNTRSPVKRPKIPDMSVINSIHIKSKNNNKTSAINLVKNSKSIIAIQQKSSNFGKGRSDAGGIPIIKGNKSHKLMFIDHLTGADLVNIIEVESYKEYNVIEDDPTPDKKNILSTNNFTNVNKGKNSDEVSCKCSIL